MPPKETPKAEAGPLGNDGKPLVRCYIPPQYGTFHSGRQGAGDVELRGGSMGLVTQRERDVYELPTQPPTGVPAVPPPVALTEDEEATLIAGRLTDKRPSEA